MLGFPTLKFCLYPQVCFFLLTRYGADPNKCNKYKATPLHYATQLSTVKTLCKFGADVTLRNVDELTPVQIAMVDGDDDDLIDYLFKVGQGVSSGHRRWADARRFIPTRTLARTLGVGAAGAREVPGGGGGEEEGAGGARRA